jgi:hypothetical protein
MLFLNSGIESVDIPGYNRNLFTGELLWFRLSPARTWKVLIITEA